MRDLRDFVEDAADGPWRPESDVDGDGLKRRRDTIWLTNDGGDSLQVDEDTAALLVNAARADEYKEETDAAMNYGAGLADGLAEAKRRLSLVGMHDGKCPEPDKSCTCGLDAAIDNPAPVPWNEPRIEP